MSTSQCYSSSERSNAQEQRRLLFTSQSPLWSLLAAAAFVDVQLSLRLTHRTRRNKGHVQFPQKEIPVATPTP